jgi:hypothetical protein
MGVTPAVYQAFFRRIAGSERLRGQLQQVLSQELPVRRLASATRFLTVAAGLLAARTASVGEVGATARLDLARRAAGVHRRYEPADLLELTDRTNSTRSSYGDSRSNRVHQMPG